MPFRFANIAVVTLTLTASLHAAEDFDRTIAPILARHCLGCHSGGDPKGGLDLSRKANAFRGGESGKAIVVGKPLKSELWKRIAANEMPPPSSKEGKVGLTKKEKAALKAWIAGGAKWGTDPIDPFRFTTNARAGYDWWALQPVRRPNVPRVAGGRNPIDAFIRRKLRSLKLTPSPPASKRVLIRRLYFDLIGLPPTPEDVKAFLADDAPDAYEKLVDRLLASPQYGERWARHWLDVARFGESQGFERDKLRTNSWRYRDWLIRAFNADMPYDKFATQQIAGDALRPGDPKAIIATGFLVAGAWDEVGQSQQSAAMKAVVRQDELEDYVSTVGQAFLGLTIHCARCHDHKFDPIRQEEYYRLTAALAGVRHGRRNIHNLRTKQSSQARAAAVAARIASLETRMTNIERDTRRRLEARLKSKKAKPIAPPKPIAAWDFTKSLKDTVGDLDVRIVGKATRNANGLGGFRSRGGYGITPKLKTDLKEKTLEAWVRLDAVNQRGGGGVIGVQTPGGVTFDSIVYAEREPARWMAGSNSFRRTKSFNGPAETEADKKLTHIAMTWSADGMIRAYRNGHPYGKAYRTSGPVTFAKGKATVLFGLRHLPAGKGKYLAGRVAKARMYDRALTSYEVAASAGVRPSLVTDDDVQKALSAADRERVKRLRFEIGHLRTHLTRWNELNTYAVAPRKPGPAHLLLRGNPARKGRVVTPGGVASLRGVKAGFELKANAPDDERRIKLVEWITDANNPLFARVAVNRLWQYHFGRGLVSTPSDFGFNGGRPSHPELLDWLAAEFVGRIANPSVKGKRKDGTDGLTIRPTAWSIKHIHRLIVTSSTYRQTSNITKRPTPANNNPQSAIPNPQSIDAGNIYLWRMNPRRLEAEAVRDAMLSVTGSLSTQQYGPGYYDFTTFTRNTQFYHPLDPVGATFHRRSLYRTWVRSGRSRFLDVFDCPDPSAKAPKRAVTITPLQALTLLNNSFVLRMSDRFASRLKALRPRIKAGLLRGAGQVTRLWQLAYARSPDNEELKAATAFIQQHGLPALCRVVLNSNEFLFVD